MEEDVPCCPLCLEDLDATDRAMQACRCSYSVCSFCLNHIRENLNGLCPACRTPYEESNFTFKEVSTEAAVKEARARASAKKERERREREQVLERERAKAMQVSQLKAKTNLKHARFVQRNLVYVIGLSLTLAREEVIRKSDMFGRFGRILRVLINRAHPYNADAPGGPSISAYILFSRDIDASAAVRQMNANVLDGREIRCAIACTKYCDALVRSGLHCGNADCLYIHEQFASADDVLSREDVLARQLGPPPPAHLFLPVRRRIDVHTHSSRVSAANAAAATAANAAVAANAAAANAAAAKAAALAAAPLSFMSSQQPPAHRSGYGQYGSHSGRSPPTSPPGEAGVAAASRSGQGQVPWSSGAGSGGWGTSSQSRSPPSPPPVEDLKRIRKQRTAVPARNRSGAGGTGRQPAPPVAKSVPPGFEDLPSAPPPPARPPGFGAPRAMAASPPADVTSRPRNIAPAGGSAPPGFESSSVPSPEPQTTQGTVPTDWTYANGSSAPSAVENADAAFSGRGIVLPTMSIQGPYDQGQSSVPADTPAFPIQALGDRSGGSLHSSNIAGIPSDLRPSRRNNSRFGFAREEPSEPPLRETVAAASHLSSQSISQLGVVGQPPGIALQSKVKSRFDFADHDLSPPQHRAGTTSEPGGVPYLMQLGSAKGGNANGLSVSFAQLSTQEKLASLFQSAQWSADGATPTPAHGPVATPGASSSSAPAKQSTSPLVPPGFREATPEPQVSAETSVNPGVASSNMDNDDGPKQKLDSARMTTAGVGAVPLGDTADGREAADLLDRETAKASTRKSSVGDGASVPHNDADGDGMSTSRSQADLTSEVELERQVQAARVREARLAAQLSELQQQIRHFDNVRT